MKLRYILAALLLALLPTTRAAVSLENSLITDSQLEFIATWDELFAGPSGLIVDIFAPPWFTYSVQEVDPSAVFVHSGVFDTQIQFGATRRFSDAFVSSTANPGVTLVVEAVPGNDFAAQFRASIVPDGGPGLVGLLALTTLVVLRPKTLRHG